MIKKIRRVLKNPKLLLCYLDKKRIISMDESKFLKIIYKDRIGKELDLENPKTFNEKIQWLKLYNKDPNYTNLVDKYEVKKYVSNIIGKEYVIPTLGVYENFNDINFEELPKQFVIKTTHDSGGVVICKNKDNFNIKKAKKKINSSLNNNYYYCLKEWPYKNVRPRIIIEKYMVDESGYELKDYKFFCFDGNVKALFIATDRNENSDTCFDFYDEKFNHLPIKNGHPNTIKDIQKPVNFEKMIEISEKLSVGIPHVRVDLYNINGKIYFGEMTFSHWSGLVPFEPEEWDYKFGEWLKLPSKKNS